MPGVLQDEQQRWCLETVSNGGGGGALYDSMVDYETMAVAAAHQQQQQQQQQQHQHGLQSPSQHAMRRLSSFSAGMKDTEAGFGGLAQSSPHLFQRSHSFGSGGGGLHSFNFFGSPPSSPAAKSDMGLSLLDVVDESDLGSGKGGFFDDTGKGSGRPELRGLTFSSSSLSGSVIGSPTFSDSLQSFNKFLPSNNEDEDAWPAVDMYGCDQFRMFEFKVRRCMRGRSHDWTECPFAHPGEKARRRDPRRFHYSGTACPDFRKGSCRRGDACEFAHGVFECWLHPARYRTQPCKDGRNCRRRVCFFAHTPEQLRLLPAAAQAATAGVRSTGQGSPLRGSYDGSPRASAAAAYDGAYGYEGSLFDGASATHVGSPLGHFSGYSAAAHSHCCVPSQISSPTSTLVGHAHSPPPLSPPLSPSASPPLSPSSPNGWASEVLPNNYTSMSAQGVMSQAALQATISQGVYSRSQSSHSMGATGHAHSPTQPAHRRHLDRLNSMPTLSIPSTGEQHRSVHSSHVGMTGSAPSSPSGVPQKSMLELIATLQQLELRNQSPPPATTQWLQQQQQQYTSGPSPLRRCSQSVPGTPTKVRWEQKEPWEIDENEEMEPMVMRVESGRDLRAKIYGRLGKESPMDADAVGGDAPDLGWVNELVREESEQAVW